MTETGGCPRFRRDRARLLEAYRDNSGSMNHLAIHCQFNWVRGARRVLDIVRLVPRSEEKNGSESKRGSYRVD